MWKEGMIKVIVDNNVCWVFFEAKVFVEPSKYGICGGRISKLTLKIADITICNYDRGWGIAPTCDLAEKALKELLYLCDGRSTDAEISYV
jgi:hypothetical protein